MNIGITGASGFIGSSVVDLALRRGHEVIAFSRSPQRQIPGCTMRPFSLERPPDVSGCDAVLHLAAETPIGIWTPAKVKRIRESRVLGTRRLAEAFAAASTPPEVLVSGSAIGFYGDAGEAALIESSPPGTGFLAETVQGWESEACAVRNARVVLLRTGIVLGNQGGALRLLKLIFRAGLGARLGDGQQWVSWIHLQDMTALALFALENLDLRGPVNGTAPWPVRNETLTRDLARAVHRPAFFVAPAFLLGLLGGFSRELLDSKRVLPGVATEHGFPFRFPELPLALKDLLP